MPDTTILLDITFKSKRHLYVGNLYCDIFNETVYSNCWHDKQLCISVFEDRGRQIEDFHCHRWLLNLESFDETQFNKINDFKVR